ncbi:hypothetical protein [Aureimonas leprariae]|uniref:Uncharacterized protein n=1 Tax=Plantimonas leprariae TaxID=2615207 RepID=A0A7V7PPV7_9HYPH|nr:hypothetical protein [Aureimonas leprariae]KAB0680094.1 hypothetical protein F6X38_09810 [Aureimonas leprariae]
MPDGDGRPEDFYMRSEAEVIEQVAGLIEQARDLALTTRRAMLAYMLQMVLLDIEELRSDKPSR